VGHPFSCSGEEGGEGFVVTHLRRKDNYAPKVGTRFCAALDLDSCGDCDLVTGLRGFGRFRF